MEAAAGGPCAAGRRVLADQPNWRHYKRVQERVEHTFARMKGWTILRDCRLKGDGVHHDMLCVARLYNLTLTG